jgi:Do/DeqQ family serine protease
MKRATTVKIVLFGILAMTMGYFIAIVGDNTLTAEPYFRETNAPLEHSQFNKIFRDVMPAVVNISTERIVKYRNNDPFFDFFRDFFGDQSKSPYREDKATSIGSGFIISKEGYIVTNSHVVARADSIFVRLSDGEKYDAELVASDPETDVAVIKIKPNKNFTTVPLGDSEAIEVGDWAIAIGNPFGLDRTLTVGVVSAKSREMGAGKFDNFIQTDAAINPGNSGGPLLNINGEVIGINTMILGGQAQNLGFAIPINMAKNVIVQLIENKEVKRQQLGVTVQEINDQVKKDLDLDVDHGLLVVKVEEKSPAEKAGIKVNDIITHLNNEKVDSFNMFARNIAFSEEGETVTLTLLRDGKSIKVKARLEEEKAPKSVEEKSWGLTLENADNGVRITDVDKKSPAYRALYPDDVIVAVNRQRIRDVKDFEKLMDDLKERDRLYFTVIRDGQMQTIVISKRGSGTLPY